MKRVSGYPFPPILFSKDPLFFNVGGKPETKSRESAHNRQGKRKPNPPYRHESRQQAPHAPQADPVLKKADKKNKALVLLLFRTAMDNDYCEALAQRKATDKAAHIVQTLNDTGACVELGVHTAHADRRHRHGVAQALRERAQEDAPGEPDAGACA